MSPHPGSGQGICLAINLISFRRSHFVLVQVLYEVLGIVSWFLVGRRKNIIHLHWNQWMVLRFTTPHLISTVQNNFKILPIVEDMVLDLQFLYVHKWENLIFGSLLQFLTPQHEWRLIVYCLFYLYIYLSYIGNWVPFRPFLEIT